MVINWGTNPMIARLHFVQNVLKIQQNPSNILFWVFFLNILYTIVIQKLNSNDN